MGTKSAWTPERRARQAEVIRRAKPWEKSTGPKTDEGKAISSRNAHKGLGREERRQMDRLARLHHALMRELIARDGVKPFSPHQQSSRKRKRSAAATARCEQRIQDLWLRIEGFGLSERLQLS